MEFEVRFRLVCSRRSFASSDTLDVPSKLQHAPDIQTSFVMTLELQDVGITFTALDVTSCLLFRLTGLDCWLMPRCSAWTFQF
jgi:hypothetical protein